MSIKEVLSITQSNDGGYSLDRFKFAMNSQVAQLAGTMSQYSMSSAELNTTGFAKALKFETTTPKVIGILMNLLIYIK